MKIKVALAGLGARGYNTYAKYQHKYPERMEITAIADTDPQKVRAAAKEFNIPENMCFSSAEEMFSKGKLADCVFITTQDRQHVGHASVALDLGYDILLEKPISHDLGECLFLLNKVKESGRTVIVCHVMRYTKFFEKIKSIISEGGIGDIVSIQAIENVGYWHYAHSFVRGNWRSKQTTSPMILQKSCHDMDLFVWLTGRKCISLNSYGSLKYFRSENAPKQAAKYCFDCPLKDTCIYSAYKIYFDNYKIGFNSGNRDWPINVVTPEPIKEKLEETLRSSPYGRCVYYCDNDVVDHQVVNMLFEDEITVDFTMSSFTADNWRSIKIMGTRGEIYGNQLTNTVEHTVFGERPVIYDISKLTDDLSGHMGGDNEMLTRFFESLSGKGGNPSTTIENSIHSHVMAFAAEESRLDGGKTILLEDFVKNYKT